MNAWLNPRLEGGRRIPELNGMRGIAIGLVVIFHYVTAIGAPNHPWWNWVVATTSAFWSGVDLFFVLSGFLIGGILMDSVRSPRFFTTFYLRRFYRIFPVYWVWLIIFVLALWIDADRRFGVRMFEDHVSIAAVMTNVTIGPNYLRVVIVTVLSVIVLIAEVVLAGDGKESR